MSAFKEALLLASRADEAVVTDDVTIFNWTATDTTLTPTRVDTATAGSATGTITFSATDATAAANIQTAIRALGGIYADATCVAGVTADNMIITVYGGYDITWSKTGGTGTITESGAAGSDTATPGSVSYRKVLGIGKFAVAKKVVLKGWNDNSLDVSFKDADGKDIFVKTAIDTSTTAADVPYVKLLTADGVAGEDGAAAANVNGGLFRGGVTAIVTTSAPVAARGLTPYAAVTFVRAGGGPRRFLERTSGPMTALAGSFPLGANVGIIRKIKLAASADTSVAPTVTDADGLVVYTKTSTDYTTAVVAQLSHEGVDQAANAVADLLDVVAKSPLTVSGSGLGSGTFTITTWTEV